MSVNFGYLQGATERLMISSMMSGWMNALLDHVTGRAGFWICTAIGTWEHSSTRLSNPSYSLFPQLAATALFVFCTVDARSPFQPRTPCMGTVAHVTIDLGYVALVPLWDSLSWQLVHTTSKRQVLRFCGSLTCVRLHPHLRLIDLLHHPVVVITSRPNGELSCCSLGHSTVNTNTLPTRRSNTTTLSRMGTSTRTGSAE